MLLQENEQEADNPQDLQGKLAALERAMVDRDLLILRQNEDIASLEDQLARAGPLSFCIRDTKAIICDEFTTAFMAMGAHHAWSIGNPA